MNYLLSKTVYVSHFAQQVIYCFEMNDFTTYFPRNILNHVGFEIFTAVTVKSKSTVYWDLPPCSLKSPTYTALQPRGPCSFY
jgi:hypothetical protein